MEKKYIVPASTFFAGVIVWVIFLLVYSSEEITPMHEVILGIITGGLLLVSAYICRRVKGPKVGNIIRASLLFVLAVFSFWLIGITSAILLLAASVWILSLVPKKSKESQIAGV